MEEMELDVDTSEGSVQKEQQAPVKRRASNDFENDENSAPDIIEINEEAEPVSEIESTEEEPQHVQEVLLTPAVQIPKILKLGSTPHYFASTSRERAPRQRHDNAHNVFGMHVAAQLGKLSSRQAIIAMDRTHSVLTHCRLADLDSSGSLNVQLPSKLLRKCNISNKNKTIQDGEM